MKHLIKISATILATLLVTALFACRSAAPPVAVSNRPSSVNGIPTTNMPLPPAKSISDMSWTKQDGYEMKMSELRGKAVILDFWATYCKPCLEEIPHLKQLQQKYGVENLQVVGLHVGGDEDRPKVPEFVDRLKIDYMLGVPEPALSSFIFAGTEGEIPQTAVFDRNGEMVSKFVGFGPEIKAQLDKAVDAAVNTKIK